MSSLREQLVKAGFVPSEKENKKLESIEVVNEIGGLYEKSDEEGSSEKSSDKKSSKKSN